MAGGARPGKARRGQASQGRQGRARRGWARRGTSGQAGLGLARRGLVWYGRQGMAGLGLVWQGTIRGGGSEEPLPLLNLRKGVRKCLNRILPGLAIRFYWLYLSPYLLDFWSGYYYERQT
jgi:hypothetical protein